jgi:hypothetical protein
MERWVKLCPAKLSTKLFRGRHDVTRSRRMNPYARVGE